VLLGQNDPVENALGRSIPFNIRTIFSWQELANDAFDKCSVGGLWAVGLVRKDDL
jgi:hypothetical protein